MAPPPDRVTDQVRRMRRMLTALFTALTVLSLVLVAGLAVYLDGQARQRALDDDLNRRGSGAEYLSYFQQGVLHLEYVADDEIVGGPVKVYVFERDAPDHLILRYPTTGEYPTLRLDQLATVGLASVRANRRSWFDLTSVSGEPTRVFALPIWNDETRTDGAGAVVVVGDPRPGQRAHWRLIALVVLGCLAAAGVGGFASHVLSGRIMRPALRGLEQQEEFLSDAAHELRNPLASLRLIAARLARTTAEADQLVTLADRLATTVTGLLRRARIEAGVEPMQRVPMRLDQIVERTLEEITDLPERTEVRLRPTVVEGDPDLLAHAVRNLVENALRHGHRPGEPAEIVVEVADGRVRVSDSGPGIDPELCARLFDRFRGRPGGSGIGLAIVRWVVELHGGTVTVTEPGTGGATFELTLPVGQPRAKVAGVMP